MNFIHRTLFARVLPGRWQQLDDIPLLAASKPASGDRTLSDDLGHRRTATRRRGLPGLPPDGGSDQDADVGGAFNRPDKTWSASVYARQNPLKRAWLSAVGFVGGRRRMLILTVTLAVIFAVNSWWQLPPPATVVYQEFTTCRMALQRLQDRRVAGPEWTAATDRYRPRIQSLVSRIKPRANSRYPAERALYEAGTQGLLPILESKSIFVSTDHVFDMHMKTARDVLDGKAVAP